MTLLRAPTDVVAANVAWKATCGPAALAAALGIQVEQTRAAVTGLALGMSKGFMNVADMRSAIGRGLGATWRDPESELLEQPGCTRVVLVQWCGPWNGVPRAAATHRHWIANSAREDAWIYDANDDEWMTLANWKSEIVPQLMPKRGTGWRLAWAAEVLRDVR